MKLERLQVNAALRGIIPDALVTVVSVQWFGSEALELTYKTALSDAALALLESMPKDGELVFAGTKGQPLSDMSMTALIRRMNGDGKPVWVDANGKGITVHGFRSSFRMWAAETTNYPREVAEHALAHQLPDAVERAYQRGSQFAKRAALMAEWAVYCATAQPNAVVKPIRGAA